MAFTMSFNSLTLQIPYDGSPFFIINLRQNSIGRGSGLIFMLDRSIKKVKQQINIIEIVFFKNAFIHL